MINPNSLVSQDGAIYRIRGSSQTDFDKAIPGGARFIELDTGDYLVGICDLGEFELRGSVFPADYVPPHVYRLLEEQPDSQTTLLRGLNPAEAEAVLKKVLKLDDKIGEELEALEDLDDI